MTGEKRKLGRVFLLLYYWIELDLRLKDQLMGQPLAHGLILNSIRSHLNIESPGKALVLSLHGSTGTGKNFVAKHVVESIFKKGYTSRYARLYVASRDFMHHDEQHVQQYKVSQNVCMFF